MSWVCRLIALILAGMSGWAVHAGHDEMTILAGIFALVVTAIVWAECEL